MNQVVVLFTLITAALLQAALPTAPWMGWAPMPLLAGLVVYYALVRSRGLVLEVAILAGIVEDSLSQVPLGTSSFLYALAGLIIERWRGSMIVRQWTTHAVAGAATNLAATAFVLLMLVKDGLIEPRWGYVVLRLAGAGLLGALAAPIVFHVMEGLDDTLGLTEAEEN